jgi:hypothetical protein
MVAWLFRWHDNHRRTALLPGIAFLGFFGLQLYTEIRFREPVLVEPVGYLVAATLMLATLASLVLSLALWLRACIIIHIDRLGMSVTGVRMAVERVGKGQPAAADPAWTGRTDSNPRIITRGLYGKGRPLAAVDEDPTEVFDEVVRFNKLDIDREPPTGDVAAS